MLSGDKFMLEIHFRQPGFTDRTCGPFTKNKERIQKFKETGDSRYIYQNELHKACFQCDIAYEDFKDLTRRTASDKYCVIKHLILLKTQNVMNIDVDLLQWSINLQVEQLKMKISQTKS